MKLIYRITIRLALALLPIMAIWGGIFYFSTVNAIDDETDETLETFSETVINRFLAGKELPDSLSSAVVYNIIPVDEGFANTIPHIRYYDGYQVFPSRGRDEARVLTTVFRNHAGDYYILKVYTATFEKDEFVKSLLIWMTVLYFVMVLVVILVTVFVFYNNLKPLYRLLGWLDSYKAGVSNEPLDNRTTVTEFKRLNESVQKALDRYDAAYKVQKEFIGNASHELQTPLAVIGNRIEWLLDNTELDERQTGELIGIQRALSNAVRLNKTLLLLTKIENKQFPETSDVDIVGLVRENVETLSDIYVDKNLQYEMKLPESMIVQMNISLASSLVGNLLKNAYIYTKVGGSIKVAVSSRFLSVSNDGEASLDRKHIFERFYKEGGREGASGLGLAIVNAIAQSYNLEIRYDFINKMHVFSVKWPKF